MFRRPKGYNGTGRTSRRLSEILPQVVQKMGRVYKERGDLILASWPQIIGPSLSTMAEAHSFEEGILYVNVKNSSLLALFQQNDKAKILENLRRKFPNTSIKNIIFRMR